MNNQSYMALNFCYNYGYNCSLHQIMKAQKTILQWFGWCGFDALQQGFNDRCQDDVKNYFKKVGLENA